MTGTDTATGEDSGVGDPSRATTKALLFCPRCDYTAPWDGPWDVRTSPGHREVTCPNCGTRVA